MRIYSRLSLTLRTHYSVLISEMYFFCIFQYNDLRMPLNVLIANYLLYTYHIVIIDFNSILSPHIAERFGAHFFPSAWAVMLPLHSRIFKHVCRVTKSQTLQTSNWNVLNRVAGISPAMINGLTCENSTSHSLRTVAFWYKKYTVSAISCLTNGWRLFSKH